MAPQSSSSSSAPALTHFLLTHPSPFIAHVEINRPDKLNAFHAAMWAELASLFRALSRDKDVRVVLLSGRGDRAFSAGLDVVAVASEGSVLDSGGRDGEGRGGRGGKEQDGDGDGNGGAGDVDVARRAHAMRRHIEDFQTCVGEVERCEKPVVALLHGICYGLAIDIACCADVRLACASARLSVKEVDIGLAADIGSLARLPKIVAGSSWVREVCLSAREFGAAEAARVGFVSEPVFDSKDAMVRAALALAARIAAKSPVAVVGTKELLAHARDHPVEDNLRYTRAWNAAMLQSDDVKIALLSGMQKTKPTFEKL